MEIVARMAETKAVERMAMRIGGSDRMTANLEDLCQMVYLALLEYDEAKIVGIWERGQMSFFVARILKNQLLGTTSRYYYAVGKQGRECDVEPDKE